MLTVLSSPMRSLPRFLLHVEDAAPLFAGTVISSVFWKLSGAADVRRRRRHARERAHRRNGPRLGRAAGK